MLTLLRRLETKLPGLLADGTDWQTLHIDYHPPVVERLWLPFGEHRICLHRIHPCGPGEALFHPHRWPSAMRVIEGHYEMAVGWGRGTEPPPVAARIVARAALGGGRIEYEMTDPDAWHYVRPLGRPALSLMVSGPPWEREAPSSGRPLLPLSLRRKDELLGIFRRIYSD